MHDENRTNTRLAIAERRPREMTIGTGGGEGVERQSPSLLLVLWRGRWLVFLCIVVALIAGAVYLAKATPIYSASSVIYVQESVPKVISDSLSTQTDETGYLFTQCQVLQSTAILGAALELPGVAETRSLRGIDNPVVYLKNQLTAVPAKQGELITVSMESTNPQDAAVIVNAVVESYIDYQSKQHKSTAVEILRILRAEMDRHEVDLRAAEQSILNFKKANPDLALLTDKGNMVMSRLEQLSDALTQAQLRSLDLKTALAEAKAVSDSPDSLQRLVVRYQLIDPGSSAIDPQLMAEYAQDQQRLGDLLDQYGPENDLVTEMQKHLDRVKGELQQSASKAAQTYLSVIQEASTAADQRVNELLQAVSEERKSAVNLNVKEAEYEELAQEEQRIERALDLLDSRIKEVNVTEDVGSLTVSVLETAKPSFMPVRPKRAQTVGMALVAGLMVGIGAAFLRDMVDHRIRSTEEIAALLDLPVLGTVPHMLGKAQSIERAQEIHLRPRSDVAEAYRTVRTAIYFGLSEVKSARTILLTSPAPGDGKTTLTSNLAISVAQAGRRVLLIDADCRRPLQHKIFKLNDEQGLSTVLTGKSTFAKSVQRTSIEKLEILPCGPMPHNPAELLNSQAFIDLLAAASKIYDQILIDAPPVVPVTDAQIIAASADATVLVLRADKSTRRMAEHAREALASVGAAVLGVVVNDVPRGKRGYGYYYYGYGYGRRYGYGRSNGNGNGNGHRDDLRPVIVAEGVLEER